MIGYAFWTINIYNYPDKGLALPKIAKKWLTPSAGGNDMRDDLAIRSARSNDNATPTMERCVAAYPARRAYKPYIQVPPRIDGVRGFIDIHCHAEYGQQDALALAKLASENGMYGILYKSIGK